MKNNKGFTLVELIASFSLALVIMFFLFQIVLTVRELYVSSGLKTEMMIKQANLERKIGLELREKRLKSVSSCGNDCYTLTFSDNTAKTLKTDRVKKTVTYGDYQVAMLEGSTIDSLTINRNTIPNVASGKNDTILVIDLPINNRIVSNRDFGIHLVYQYDSRTTNLGL